MQNNNINLAKQFNAAVSDLLLFKKESLGPTEAKACDIMLTKLKVITATKPFVIYELWCTHVMPYHASIAKEDDSVWATDVVHNDEVFQSFGATEAWGAMNELSRKHIWRHLKKINKLCVTIYKKQKEYGLLDALDFIMEAAIQSRAKK